MPYKDQMLNILVEDFGFDRSNSVKCLEANRHNHITATYHLLIKKQERRSKLNKSDLSIMQDNI